MNRRSFDDGLVSSLTPIGFGEAYAIGFGKADWEEVSRFAPDRSTQEMTCLFLTQSKGRTAFSRLPFSPQKSQTKQETK